MVTGVQLEGRIGKSDHDVISFEMCVSKTKEIVQQMLPDYRKVCGNARINGENKLGSQVRGKIGKRSMEFYKRTHETPDV